MNQPDLGLKIAELRQQSETFYAVASPANPVPCDIHFISGCCEYRPRPLGETDPLSIEYSLRQINAQR